MSTSDLSFKHKNSSGLFPCLLTRRRFSFLSIVDPFPNARSSLSFVHSTSSDPSFDPGVVPRLIPNYVTDLETNQDTTFPNNDGIYTNDKVFPDILQNPIVSFVGPRFVPQIIISNVGPKVVPDTAPSVDSSETPSIDLDHHLETSPVPYNGRNYFNFNSTIHPVTMFDCPL